MVSPPLFGGGSTSAGDSVYYIAHQALHESGGPGEFDLCFGDRGVVEGAGVEPHPGSPLEHCFDSARVVVRFPKIFCHLELEALSREPPPPLQWDFKPGAAVYYVGGQAGGAAAYGACGTVVGPHIAGFAKGTLTDAASISSGAINVEFDGGLVDVCTPEELQLEKPPKKLRDSCAAPRARVRHARGVRAVAVRSSAAAPPNPHPLADLAFAAGCA